MNGNKWPEIVDSEGVDIENNDILEQDGQYIVANADTLETIGDGSAWRIVGSLRDGEGLGTALERIQDEVNR